MGGASEHRHGDLAVVCEQLEIFDLFNLYAEALDRKLWALLEDVFTEDVTATCFGEHERSGRDDVVGFIRSLVGNVGRAHHLFGNYAATICGDVAEASVSVRAYYGGSGAAQHVFLDSLGSLEGELVLTRDGWRFRRLAEELFVVGGTRDVFACTAEPEPSTVLRIR
jgi:hypothetical protein